MKRPKSRRVALIDTLLGAYDSGATTLRYACPACLQHMGSHSNGVCISCGKRCGCSFNPEQVVDLCTMHGERNEYQRNT